MTGAMVFATRGSNPPSSLVVEVVVIRVTMQQRFPMQVPAALGYGLLNLGEEPFTPITALRELAEK